MNKIKSYVSGTFQQAFVNNVYKSYRIRLDLSDSDKYYLTLNDKTAIKTGSVLETIHKCYPQILDYKNQDAVFLVKHIIRIRALCPEERSLQYITDDARSNYISQSDYHRLLTSVGNVDNDPTIYKIMRILDARNNFNDILLMVEENDNLVWRTEWLHSIYIEMIRTSAVHRHIPPHMYKADTHYLGECAIMALHVPELSVMLPMKNLLIAKNNDAGIIQSRKLVLAYLDDAKVLDSSIVERVFLKRRMIKDSVRYSEHIKTGNIAYCLMMILSRQGMLTPSVLYSICDAIEIASKGEAASTPDAIVGNKIIPNILNPIVKEMMTDALYLMNDDWTERVSIFNDT